MPQTTPGSSFERSIPSGGLKTTGKVEATAKKAETDRTRAVAEMAQLAVFEWDARADSMHYDGAAEGVLGVAGQPGESLEGFLARVAPAHRSELRQKLQQLLAEATECSVSFGLAGGTHDRRSIEGRVRVLRDENGEVSGFIAVASNVSQRVETEEALKASETRYRTLFEQAPIPIAFSDAEGKLVAFNQALLRTGGYGPDEADRLSHLAQLYYDDGEREEMLERVARTASLERHEMRFRRQDGSPFLGALTVVPVTIGDHALTISMIEDLSQRHELEEQLFRSQKLEAVGQLAGGIAHDFNNLVTVILGYTEYAADDLADDDPLRSSLEQIKAAAHRAAELTRQLLAFARKQIVQPQVVVLTDLVLDMDKMLRRLIGEDIELVTLAEPELWPISFDPGQLEQVLVNLVVNARDAMPTGGKLTIETRNADLGAGHPEHTRMPPGRYVQVSVSDTGVGMSEETRLKVFEPFFTTKGQGKGTGLGLATCYGVVKQAGGFIWAKSQLNRGTTFELYLPTAEEITEELIRTAPSPVSHEGEEVILLVEDEPQVNDLATRALEDRGYTVHAAQTGDEALRLAERHPDFDLLVSDVVLPKMTGHEVADRLRRTRPGLRVLFISGYAEGLAERKTFSSATNAFLHKPFAPADLAAKVRSVLDSAATSEGSGHVSNSG